MLKITFLKAPPSQGHSPFLTKTIFSPIIVTGKESTQGSVRMSPKETSVKTSRRFPSSTGSRPPSKIKDRPPIGLCTSAATTIGKRVGDDNTLTTVATGDVGLDSARGEIEPGLDTVGTKK